MGDNDNLSRPINAQKDVTLDLTEKKYWKLQNGHQVICIKKSVFEVAFSNP